MRFDGSTLLRSSCNSINCMIHAFLTNIVLVVHLHEHLLGPTNQNSQGTHHFLLSRVPSSLPLVFPPCQISPPQCSPCPALHWALETQSLYAPAEEKYGRQHSNMRVQLTWLTTALRTFEYWMHVRKQIP